MPVNQPRGTPGMLLLGFSCALLLVAAVSWELRREQRAAPSAVDLSGIGDARFYTSLSDNDFLHPALVFPDAPHGLFRRAVNPVDRDDAEMRRAGTEKSGRYTVYTDAPPKPGPGGAPQPRWYLKAADHRYVEFGGRKYFENSPPAKN